MKKYNAPWIKKTNPGTNTEAGPEISGKDISSRNATKHGCCSTETLILPSESKEEFKSLEAAWFRAYEPTDTAEVHLVHQLTQADWFLQRSVRTLAQAEAQIQSTVTNPLDWTEDHHKAIARFQRYRTSHTNNVLKRQKAIEDYRKNRTAEQHKQEKQTIVKAKFEVFKEKNKPTPTWEEELDMMREKAKLINQAKLERERELNPQA